MPQYWIQTPVENAKEVVQRYLDANSGTLTDYVNPIVSYDDQCEVVLYNSDLTNFSWNFNTIYFGNFILPISENAGTIGVGDDTGNYVLVLDILNATYQSGEYKSVIWNLIQDATTLSQLYFVGYKFNITIP